MDDIEERLWDGDYLLLEAREDDDGDGVWESLYWYEYDADGVLEAYEFEALVDGALDYELRAEYGYDNLGRIAVRELDYDRDGDQDYQVDYEYTCD